MALSLAGDILTYTTTGVTLNFEKPAAIALKERHCKWKELNFHQLSGDLTRQKADSRRPRTHLLCL